MPGGQEAHSVVKSTKMANDGGPGSKILEFDGSDASKFEEWHLWVKSFWRKKLSQGAKKESLGDELITLLKPGTPAFKHVKRMPGLDRVLQQEDGHEQLRQSSRNVGNASRLTRGAKWFLFGGNDWRLLYRRKDSGSFRRKWCSLTELSLQGMILWRNQGFWKRTMCFRSLEPGGGGDGRTHRCSPGIRCGTSR